MGSIFVHSVHLPCVCTPYIQESKKLRVLTMNRNLSKSSASGNRNKIFILSWKNPLGLILSDNCSKITERVRAPRDVYFNVKRGAQYTQLKKNTNSISMIQQKGASDKRVRGQLGAIILDIPRGVTALGLKAPSLFDNISGSYGGGWGEFVGQRRLLG